MKYNHIDNSNAPYPVNKIIPYLFFLHTVILLSNAITVHIEKFNYNDFRAIVKTDGNNAVT